MMDMANRYPDKAHRPDHILWNGLKVKTADRWLVPIRGTIQIAILSKSADIEQGVDVKFEDGALQLSGGENISLLRTWADSRYEDTVSYPYFSQSGRICVWNVYKLNFPNGRIREAKWTGNAGFWVDEPSSGHRIYHCSHGMAVKPDFDLFTFRIVAHSAEEIPLIDHT